MTQHPSPTLTPTDEQQAIVDTAQFSGPSIMMNAFAGCAKSATLKMISDATPLVPTLALAFNTRIKKELEEALPKNGKFTVKTLNGLGHQAFGRAIGRRLTIVENKLGKLVSAALKEFEELQDDEEAWKELIDLVGKAMQVGLVPSKFPHRSLLEDSLGNWMELADQCWIGKSVELKCKVARLILIESIKESFAGNISFDDQIYMSALFGGVFDKYPRVLGDEAQDFSPLNHKQIRSSVLPEGRLLVAGDRKQAIYAFRGADASSMENIKALRKDWVELPLTISFRCPGVVVDRQAHHAVGFRAWHTNPYGEFHKWSHGKGSPDNHWDWAKLRALADNLRGGQPAIAVICRNNAPLLAMAFALIRQKIAPVMLGRDIGKGLIRLAKSICPEDLTPLDVTLGLVEDWRHKECANARSTGKDHKLAGINDRADCLLAVGEDPQVTTAGKLRKALEDLFSKTAGQVTLGSGHKVKGLEYDLVVHLDHWRIPSKYALKAADSGDLSQLDQEHNLGYVIETRTRNTLIEAGQEDFQ